ncbi:MAG TPA: c-type cytochrome domain-containing protein [Fimbriimonadaceae bacterium]|jgi:mono/diheme cytochrome c family protein
MRFSLSLAAIAVVIFAIGCSKGGDDTSTASSTTSAGTTGTPAPAAGAPSTTTTGTAAATTGTTAAATGKGYAAVQAIFTSSCLPCHASGKPKAGVDMSNYDGVMKGGEHGKIVVAGDSKKSDLIGFITGTKQPAMPKNRPPLSTDQVKVISDWIDAGAKND